MTILDQIETAMAAGSFNCKITYGLDPSEIEVKGMIEDYGIARIIQPTTVDLQSDIVVSSGGLLWDIAAFMIVIGNSSKAAVDGLHAWFVGIGFETENGVIGIPAQAPWAFQDLRIYRWQPAGGLPVRAEKLGEKWVALVACDIQVRKV